MVSPLISCTRNQVLDELDEIIPKSTDDESIILCLTVNLTVWHAVDYVGTKTKKPYANENITLWVYRENKGKKFDYQDIIMTTGYDGETPFKVNLPRVYPDDVIYYYYEPSLYVLWSTDSSIANIPFSMNGIDYNSIKKGEYDKNKRCYRIEKYDEAFH
jgi:hypothetical protein